MRKGILHPVYRGVFAWGHHNVPLEGRFLAATKACGPYAVLSHYSAAALEELVSWDGRPFEVTAPTRREPGSDEDDGLAAAALATVDLILGAPR